VRLGDHAGLMDLYVMQSRWEDAFRLLKGHPGTAQYAPVSSFCIAF
jgi:hypothetical protein